MKGKNRWLAAQRVLNGLSQEEAAREIGISQTALSDFECGRRAPSVKVAKKIAAIFDFAWTRFYEEDKP